MTWTLACLAISACGKSGDGPSFSEPLALTILSPQDGATLTAADDEDPGRDGVQATVIVQAVGLTETDTVALYLDSPDDCDGAELASSSASAETIELPGVTVPEGEHTLQACARDGEVASSKVSITVEEDGGDVPPPPPPPDDCTIAFVIPSPESGSVTLGAADDQDEEPCGETFLTQVVVSTNAADGSQARLFVNGAERATVSVSGLTATFNGVALDNRGDTPNELEVEIQGEDTTCREAFPANVFVECEGPSCAITSPDPAAGILNAEDDTSDTPGFQTDFEVTTDERGVDNSVRLVIDGDETGAPIALASAEGSGGVARFNNVDLSEGLRRVHALCTDSLGNVTQSGTVEWLVDVTPCEITIDDFAGGASPITDEDDLDPLEDGIQVSAAGSISGDGCAGVRIGVCSAMEGAFDADALSNGSWTLPVTLGSAPSQTICAEVRDEAGNVGSTQITVSVRTEGPQLEIVSPVSGTGYNIEGSADSLGNVRIADLNPATSTCEAAFTVHCTDVGVNVQLLRESTGTVLSTAVCQAQDGLPAPYKGVAQLPMVSLPSIQDGSTFNIVARQEADGFVGLSTPVSLQADCIAPTLSVSRPICGTVLRPSEVDVSEYRVDILNSNNPKPPVDLEIRQASSGTVVYSATSSTPEFPSPVTQFPNANLSAGGELEIGACATDNAGNIGCAPACVVTVADLPTLQIVTPVNGTVLTMDDDCDAAAGFQLQVQAETDAAVDSDATLKIGGQPAVNTSVQAGSPNFVDVCIDAADGRDLPVEVTIVDETRGTVQATVTISILTEPPTTPISDLAATVPEEHRRAGRALFTWTAVDDGAGGPLAAYRMRCAEDPIASEEDWNSASPKSISRTPASGGASESDLVGGFKPSTAQHCALRGEDITGALTPLDGSVEVTVSLLEQEVMESGSGHMGDAVAAVGDVNGDGIDDVLIGSFNAPSYLYFGSTQGLPSTPSVTLDGGASGGFGRVVAGLGDVNGDGVPDFAITARAANTVYVLFGRSATDPAWPASVDLTEGGCGADLCLTGDDGGFFGWRITGTDFDGDGINDIIVSAQQAFSLAGRVYVIRGSNAFVSGSTFSVPGAGLTGFTIDPPATRKRLGAGLASPGDFLAGDGRADLVIGAAGDTVGTSVEGALLTLAGRSYPSSSTGFVPVASTELTLVDTGIAGVYGAPVVAIGDYDGNGRVDVAVGEVTSVGKVYVYLQTAAGFSAASRIEVTNNVASASGDLFGGTIGEGSHTSLGRLGDVDGDGMTDILVGSAQNGTNPGTAEIFLGNASPVDLLRTEATISLDVGATARLVATYIGDVNGDGFADIALGDPAYSSNTGRVILVY